MTTTRLTTHLDATGAATRSQLVVIEGPEAGRAVLLDGTRHIGTADENDLRLSDERVSARHCRVAPHQAGFHLDDLGSTNGTWLEGVRVASADIPVGTVLKVGRTFLRIQPEVRPLEVVPSASRRFGELVAESIAMREVFAVLELASQSDITVLVTGETGTGKELVARAIHDASPRRAGPFVVVDCGALPETLLESELFGHAKHSFTGAHTERRGAFQRAHNGTLFLDELGAVSAAVQARLLRALESRTVRPVGADDDRPVDVRVLAATPVDLATRVASGAFRSDLYYRLSVLAVELPPLRARREDIAPVVAALLKKRGWAEVSVSGPNLDRLMAHGWPGNVRELRNVIDRAVALNPLAASFDALKLFVQAVDLPEQLVVRSNLEWKEAKESLLQAFEARYLRDVHAQFDGNVSAGARFAGLDRKHWRELLQRHGLLSVPEE